MSKDKLKIEYINIAELSPAEYNPRIMSGEMLEKLKKGLTEFGFVDPLIVNKNGRVIGGHQRLVAAEALGFTEVPCVTVDLPEPKEKALNLALNKLAGEWDFIKLSTILSEFEALAEFDIELTGFDAIESVELTEFGGLEDMKFPGEGGEGSGEGKKGYMIQFTIIFDNEDQQEVWKEYVKELKETYPEMETIAGRIIHDIRSRR